MKKTLKSFPRCCFPGLSGAFLGFLLLLPAKPAEAFVRWHPVYGASFMLGQHFFDGDPSSWGGNFDLRAVPAVQFSENLILIPSLSIAYQGTKDVTELAGGSQLFQDSMKVSLNLKPVYQWGKLKTKPYVGYRLDYLRETKDEKLGKGLFDYRKASAGLELEYAVNKLQWATFSADYYTIRFPNYSSLESQVAAGLGRENAGSKTLDSDNAALSMGWNTDTPFPRTRASFELSTLGRGYPNQHVVDEAGQLKGSLRKDAALTYSGTLSWSTSWAGKADLKLSAGLGQTVVDSNQNHYDARLARFLPGYYDYQETNVRPALELSLPKKGSFTAAYLVGDRLYYRRPIQDEEGTYLHDRVSIRSKTFAFGLIIPVKPGFKVLAQSYLTDASSNQRYEKVFRYDYNLASHFLGVAYEY